MDGWMDKLNGWLVYGGMDDVNHHCMKWMDIWMDGWKGQVDGWTN